MMIILYIRVNCLGTTSKIYEVLPAALKKYSSDKHLLPFYTATNINHLSKKVIIYRIVGSDLNVTTVSITLIKLYGVAACTVC